jgi:hypothetical protein
MVVMSRKHYDSKSFIKDGPIRYLEDSDKGSVFSFDWQTRPHASNSWVVEPSFTNALPDIKSSIDAQITKAAKTANFDADNFGHKILLACAIVQFCGAAILTDIENAFETMGIDVEQSAAKRMMFCASAVGWVQKVRHGNQDFYIAKFPNSNCDFSYKDSASFRDTLRWKTDVRVEWRTTEPIRSRFISSLQEVVA